MKKVFVPLTIVTALMLAYAPVLIANAPFESTMGLIQKIFYFHVPSWFAMFAQTDRLAVSAAEVAVVFGLIGLVTGPLWARKSWGVWWQWDAHLTMALIVELIFVGYLLLRAYGGPGSEKLSAAVAIFGMANVPFVYVSANIWRTVHPPTSVVPELGRTAPGMAGPFWYCVLAFMLLFTLLFSARVHLERRRAELDELYLDEEE
ncbi:MAG: hypothetical protein DMF91_00795 [Acidobacteria bacterium]|nr:MAG: hypothetical protein DMF91_00795 [Acidobacteriota bacterium]